MDIVENENFHNSVFKNLNQKFWYKRESWKHATKVFGWKFDAWHIAKSSMIIMLCVAIVSYHPFVILIDMVVLGTVWNLTFLLFYELFKTKQK